MQPPSLPHSLPVVFFLVTPLSLSLFLWVSLSLKNKVPKQCKNFQNHLISNFKRVIEEKISESNPGLAQLSSLMVAGAAEQTFVSLQE